MKIYQDQKEIFRWSKELYAILNRGGIEVEVESIKDLLVPLHGFQNLVFYLLEKDEKRGRRIYYSKFKMNFGNTLTPWISIDEYWPIVEIRWEHRRDLERKDIAEGILECLFKKIDYKKRYFG